MNISSKRETEMEPIWPEQSLPRASTFADRRSLSGTHSPIRHHRRAFSTGPKEVKETLNAKTIYTEDAEGNGSRVLNQYTLGEELGRGSYGCVMNAVDQDGKEYAIKEFSKSILRRRSKSNLLRGPKFPSPRQTPIGRQSPGHTRSVSELQMAQEAGNPLNLIREEIAIMKKLDHTNVVRLYEVLDDPNEDSLYMVMEKCSKGAVMKIGLDQTVEPYPEERCRVLFRDLVLGMEYLHAQGICHRDLKPENLLLDDQDTLKIVDFGVSEMFEKNSPMLTSKASGSPAFQPPELCTPGHGQISGTAADIWSMGVLLYCLCFGKLPFNDKMVLQLYEKIREDDVIIPDATNPKLVDVLQRLLEKDPNKRITMRELRDHPWVTADGEDPLMSEEENTADIIPPPSKDDIKKAVTSSMSIRSAITVLKALKTFKSLSRKSSFSNIQAGGQSRSDSLTVESPIPMHQRSKSLDANFGGLSIETVRPVPTVKPTRLDSAVVLEDTALQGGEQEITGTPTNYGPQIEVEFVESPTSDGPLDHDKYF